MSESSRGNLAHDGSSRTRKKHKHKHKKEKHKTKKKHKEKKPKERSKVSGAKKQSKLFDSIRAGIHSDVVFRIFCGGVDLNGKNEAGEAPLHVACQCGSVEIAAVLIEHGADVSVRNKNGATPLHVCVAKRFTAVAKLLVKEGADTGIDDYDSVSAADMGVDELLQQQDRAEREESTLREEHLKEKIKEEELEVGLHATTSGVSCSTVTL